MVGLSEAMHSDAHGWEGRQAFQRTVCLRLAATSPARTRWSEFKRVNLRTVLRLTEPRSGPRVCDSQQLRQAGSAWKIQHKEAFRRAAAHRAHRAALR